MADAIATNTTLKELEYALSTPALLSIPADSACFTISHTAHPCRCHSLQHNELDDSAKQQLEEAAGGRITLLLNDDDEEY